MQRKWMGAAAFLGVALCAALTCYIIGGISAAPVPSDVARKGCGCGCGTKAQAAGKATKQAPTRTGCGCGCGSKRPVAKPAAKETVPRGCGCGCGSSRRAMATPPRDYDAAATVPQPIEVWKALEYGCGGNPRTQEKLQTDAKRSYPVVLTWPLIHGAGKYRIEIEGIRGSRPTTTLEATINSLRLTEQDIAPGRYQWSVSVYDEYGNYMGDVETIEPVEYFAIADPDPVAPNGKRALIDAYHSTAAMNGWGRYNGTQYMMRELLENAGFEVHVNEAELLTPERLKSVDLLTCYYFWSGNPEFRPYSGSELSAVREYVGRGGALLVGGCDRKDVGARSGKMGRAASQLVRQFGLAFEVDEMPERPSWVNVAADQDIISYSKRVFMQLPVGVRGEDAITLLEINGVPIAQAKQYGQGKVIAAGVGMSFLDSYVGDFKRREPLHLIMFYDFVRYLTGIDWEQQCEQLFVESVLARCDFDT